MEISWKLRKSGNPEYTNLPVEEAKIFGNPAIKTRLYLVSEFIDGKWNITNLLKGGARAGPRSNFFYFHAVFDKFMPNNELAPSCGKSWTRHFCYFSTDGGGGGDFT